MSWRRPGELMRAFIFLCFSVFVKKKSRTAAADGSVRYTLWSRPGTDGSVLHVGPASGFLRGRPLQVPDLFDQVSLFIVELFVLRSVVLELAEKLDEFGLVLQQDVQDGLRLVGVGHKHLAEVKEGGEEKFISQISVNRFFIVLNYQQEVSSHVCLMAIPPWTRLMSPALRS